MNAKEARQLSEQNKLTKLPNIISAINRAALGGETSIIINEQLYTYDEHRLKELGYNINKEEETMYCRPSGWITTVS